MMGAPSFRRSLARIMMTLRCLSLSLVLCAALAPGLAQAQSVADGDKAAARQLTIDGHAALGNRDYATAADLFSRADKLFHAPTVTLGLARAQVGLGKLVSASELYNRLVHEPLPPNPSEAFTRAMDDGRNELAALAPRIPSLIIQVKGTDAPRVTLDGAEVPAAVLGIKRPVDPGKHVVHAVGRRALPGEVTVTVAEGKVETVTLELAPAPAGTPDAPDTSVPPVAVVAPGSSGMPPVAGNPGVPFAPIADASGSGGGSRKPLGFALLGVGAAGVVVGAITGGLASSKRSSLIQQCPTGHCLPSQQPALQGDVNSLNTLASISTAGFIAGGVLAAAGIIVVVTSPKAKSPTAFLAPLVGPGFAGLQGGF